MCARLNVPGLLPTEAFRDPVHGYIGVYSWEKDIIDTRTFQRLRSIRQLGPTFYLYHGAEHSRFGHSLGVMHLAGRVVGNILHDPNNRPFVSEIWPDGDFFTNCKRIIVEARLAGLLHDIGHAPFSHTGEEKLFAKGKTHENYTVELICSPTLDIGDLIDSNSTLASLGVTSERVASTLSKTGIYEVGFVREVLSSVWDVDKMDYLLRDSLYCGVRYGLYDLDRIIDTVCLYKRPSDGALRLGIDGGGLHAIEAFILARYFMFTQVYYHRVRRAYDLLLTDFVAGVLNDVLRSPQYPEDLTEYLSWTDWRILAAVEERTDDDTLAWCLANRQHPKPVYESMEYADHMVVDKAIAMEHTLRKAFQDKAQVWADQATDHPERFRSGTGMPIRIDGSWRDLKTVSKALAGLEEIKLFRLYGDVRGDPCLEKEMREFCQSEMAR